MAIKSGDWVSLSISVESREEAEALLGLIRNDLAWRNGDPWVLRVDEGFSWLEQRKTWAIAFMEPEDAATKSLMRSVLVAYLHGLKRGKAIQHPEFSR